MPRMTDEAREEKRLDILHAALECFSSKGYYASKVDDIVSYSGTSKGTIYNYFSSKEDIFVGILQNETRNLRAELETNLPKYDSPLEKLRYWINTNIPYNPHKKKLMRVHIEFWLYSTDIPKLQHILTDRFDQLFHMVQTIIEEGQQCGEFKTSVDPERASAMFWSMHDGLWLHATIGYNEDKMEERIKDMEAAMIAYLT